MLNVPSTRREWYIDPFSELENLQREMNKLFDFFFTNPGYADKALLSGQWAPSVDLYDSKDNIVVKADLPGINKDDIDVAIQDDVLTIRGEKKRSSEIKEDDFVRTERFVGTFHRSVKLSSSVDRDKVQANYKNGVLELILPKKEDAKPRKITIDVK